MFEYRFQLFKDDCGTWHLSMLHHSVSICAANGSYSKLRAVARTMYGKSVSWVENPNYIQSYYFNA